MNGYKNIELQRYIRNIGLVVFSVPSETVSVPAGAAGTLKTCQLEARPVLDSIGGDIGSLSDTSLVLTGTAFTTEVAPTDDANLTNGQYWVDYVKGKIRGKKADTSTSIAAVYKTFAQNSRERFQSGAEDNTNLNLAVIERLLAGVSTYAPSLFTNYGANLTLNVKAGAGNVYSIHAQNTNAAIRYIQIHNTATTPAGGAVPLVSFAIPAASFKDIDHKMLPAGGVYCSTGIAFAISTTLATYTASATANEHNTFITYK